MDELNEKIRQQINLLAEISQRKDTSISEVIECSMAIGHLYKALLQL